MVKLTTNELRLVARKRGIKNYKNMSKEGLLIALLKLEKSLTELQSNSAKIEETKKLFN